MGLRQGTGGGEMTDLEMTKLCAEAMGWRTFKERRGDYSLCVSVAPGERMPWESRKTPNPERYQEVPIDIALTIGFFARSIPDPLKDDAQAMALVKKFY